MSAIDITNLAKCESDKSGSAGAFKTFYKVVDIKDALAELKKQSGQSTATAIATGDTIKVADIKAGSLVKNVSLFVLEKSTEESKFKVGDSSDDDGWIKETGVLNGSGMTKGKLIECNGELAMTQAGAPDYAVTLHPFASYIADDKIEIKVTTLAIASGKFLITYELLDINGLI